MTKVLIAFLIVFAFSSCGQEKQEMKSETKNPPMKNTTSPGDKSEINPDALLGSWTSGEYKMGFELLGGGKAASINMATLDYDSWKLEGNKLFLKATSKGVSNPGTSDEVYIIKGVTPGSLMLTPGWNEDTVWTYTRK